MSDSLNAVKKIRELTGCNLAQAFEVYKLFRDKPLAPNNSDQRRFELAKAALTGLSHHEKYISRNDVVADAIYLADATLAALEAGE